MFLILPCDEIKLTSGTENLQSAMTANVSIGDIIILIFGNADKFDTI